VLTRGEKNTKICYLSSTITSGPHKGKELDNGSSSFHHSRKELGLNAAAGAKTVAKWHESKKRTATIWPGGYE